MTPSSREQRLRQARDEQAKEYGIHICKTDCPTTGDKVNIAYDFKSGWDAGVAWADNNPKDNYSKEDVKELVEALKRITGMVNMIKNPTMSYSSEEIYASRMAREALSKFTAKGEREK